MKIWAFWELVVLKTRRLKRREIPTLKDSFLIAVPRPVTETPIRVAVLKETAILLCAMILTLALGWKFLYL